jgi:hypothetical protein
VEELAGTGTFCSADGSNCDHRFRETFDQIIHSVIHSGIASFIQEFIHSFIQEFIRSVVLSWFHSVGHSFIHSFNNEIEREDNLWNQRGEHEIFEPRVGRRWKYRPLIEDLWNISVKKKKKKVRPRFGLVTHEILCRHHHNLLKQHPFILKFILSIQTRCIIRLKIDLGIELCQGINGPIKTLEAVGAAGRDIDGLNLWNWLPSVQFLRIGPIGWGPGGKRIGRMSFYSQNILAFRKMSPFYKYFNRYGKTSGGHEKSRVLEIGPGHL